VSDRPGPRGARPTVDAHHHLWDPAHRRQQWLEDAAMSALHRRLDVADLAAACGHRPLRTVLVQVLPDETETPEFLATAAASAHGDATAAADTTAGVRIAGVVGWVDLTAPDVAERLASLKAAPGGRHLVGIRHLVQSEADPGWLQRADVLRGLAAVAAAGLVYDLLVLPSQLPAAVHAAAAVPGGRFVLDHLGKPPIAAGWSGADRRSWVDSVESLARLPNVAVKVSGLVTEADHGRWTVDDLRPWVQTALDAFGPRRTMFGSDWPVCLLAASWSGVVDAWRELTGGLDEHEAAEAGGGTAERWYALPA